MISNKFIILLNKMYYFSTIDLSHFKEKDPVKFKRLYNEYCTKYNQHMIEDIIREHLELEQQKEQQQEQRNRNRIENLPINKIKQSIQAGKKMISLRLIDKLSNEELEEALSYLDRIITDKPTNKTIPIIREAIIRKLNKTDYIDEPDYILK